MSQKLEQEATTLYPSFIGAVRDDKAWAKRFVWRYRQGDKELSSIQIQFSHQALGLDPKASVMP